MEEFIDIVDDKGEPTGERKLKSAIHRDGDRHKVVHVWIMNPHAALLLQRRSPAKENYPNLWDISYAGHISAGETSRDAAIREGQEELGLAVTKDGLEYLFTVDNPRILLNHDTYIDHEFQDVYLLRIKDNFPTFKLQTEEVAETKWVPWKELEATIKQDDSGFVPHREEYKKLFSKINEG